MREPTNRQLQIISLFPYKIPIEFGVQLGDCRTRIEPQKTHWEGPISFKSHLGKPLTKELWVDLAQRLNREYISVYGPGFGEQKTIGILGGGRWARIYLDDQFMVEDILITL